MSISRKLEFLGISWAFLILANLGKFWQIPYDLAIHVQSYLCDGRMVFAKIRLN